MYAQSHKTEQRDKFTKKITWKQTNKQKNKHTKYVIELQRNKQNKENNFKNKPNRIPTKP